MNLGTPNFCHKGKFPRTTLSNGGELTIHNHITTLYLKGGNGNPIALSRTSKYLSFHHSLAACLYFGWVN